MKVTIKREPTYIVELTSAEANWLKSVMQNPLCGLQGTTAIPLQVTAQSLEAAPHRENLFNELKKVLGNG